MITAKRFLVSGKRLDPWLRLMPSQRTLVEDGTLTVSDGKLCLRLPQPDGAALRRIGRGSFPRPLTGGGGHAATTGGLWCSRLPPSNALDEVQGGASCFVFRCMFGYFAANGARIVRAFGSSLTKHRLLSICRSAILRFAALPSAKGKNNGQPAKQHGHRILSVSVDGFDDDNDDGNAELRRKYSRIDESRCSYEPCISFKAQY